MSDGEPLPPPRPLPTNRTAVPRAESNRGRRVAVMALAGCVLAFVAGGGGYLLGRRGDGPASRGGETAVAQAPNPPAATTPAVTSPTATPSPAPTATVAPTPTLVPTATAAARPTPASTTPEPTPAPEPRPADPDVETPADAPADVWFAAVELEEGRVPESRGIVRDGRIFLVGAVPDQEAADEIVEIAGAVLGPENVFNFYMIDSRAADAGLGNVRVDDQVLFEPGSSEIAEEFHPLLNQAVALMTLRPGVQMTIEGHTDSVGDESTNLELSQARADAVAEYLVERGVESDRLTATGRGESAPVAPNDTLEGRELNRRIQVFLLNLLTD